MRSKSTRGRLPACGLLLGLVLGPIMVLSGQSPAPDSVNVPGWTPADRVRPSISVSVHQDRTTKLWTYTYRVSNQQSAAQALTKLGLVLKVSVESAKAPDGWWAAVYNPPAVVPGVTFAARQARDGSWPGAATGGQQVVFKIVSRHGPGSVEFYARGDPPPISLDTLDPVKQAQLPNEQQDALRGTTVGPVP